MSKAGAWLRLLIALGMMAVSVAAFLLVPEALGWLFLVLAGDKLDPARNMWWDQWGIGLLVFIGLAIVVLLITVMAMSDWAERRANVLEGWLETKLRRNLRPLSLGWLTKKARHNPSRITEVIK